MHEDEHSDIFSTIFMCGRVMGVDLGMKTLTLSKIATIMQGRLSGTDRLYQGLSTDTRSLKPGDLFVAIPGERCDGHDLLAEAQSKGAVGAVISKMLLMPGNPGDQRCTEGATDAIMAQTSDPALFSDFPTILVKDTIKALGLFGAFYRKQYPIPVVAVTGSSGKTSVKDLLGAIFAMRGPVLCTQGNLNTEIGVPLTLLGLKPEHQVAVIEMGARRAGDIRDLMSIAEPTVSVIINAGLAHVGVFGDKQAIERAKGEIYAHLNPQGIAVLNADESACAYWQGLLKETQTVVHFGLTQAAQWGTAHPEHPMRTANNRRTERPGGMGLSFSAASIRLQPQGSDFECVCHSSGTRIPIHLPLPGQHNVANALAAISVARALQVDWPLIQQGLAHAVITAGRLEHKQSAQGLHIIDDSYNANPSSMEAAVQVLAQYPGPKILVMGDMLELGDSALALHAQIGGSAAAQGIDALYGYGPLTVAAVQAFGPRGLHFQTKEALIERLIQDLGAGPMIQDVSERACKQAPVVPTILIKGSRSMAMETIVRALMSQDKVEAMHSC